MILLIDAGGIRSSASLSKRTVFVSASIIMACLASVSMPGPAEDSGVDGPLFGPGSAGCALVAVGGLFLTAALIGATCQPAIKPRGRTTAAIQRLARRV